MIKSITLPCKLSLIAAFALSILLGNEIQAQSSVKSTLTIGERANDILSHMSLDEKIGQITQVDHLALKNPEDIKEYFIGSVLSGGDSDIGENIPLDWANLYDKLQSFALKTPLKIPIIYGIDAIHGDNNVYGAVIFPHNIGLGCTRNPELVEKSARVTAEEIAGTGIDWTFAPCIAVPLDERWGRTYEGFGETSEIQVMMADAQVRGFQSNYTLNTSILACAKHFVGDGGTRNGKNAGDTQCDEKTLRAVHLPGYIAAIKAGVGSIMASYSSWNGLKMHGNKYLLTDVLKEELGFDGFVVSDWKGINDLPGNYKEQIISSINAGIDMVMVPDVYKKFITLCKEAVNEGKIPIARIDDAVKRILKIKLKLGLFENPYTDRTLISSIGSEEHRAVARECVRQSLVLLKNENNILPLKKNFKRIHVAGKNADDLGNQCGGWTIRWQGQSGKITIGTTVLQAIIKEVDPKTKVTYSIDGSGSEGADVGIVVIGETPYAEGNGDKKDLSLSKEDVAAVNTFKEKGIPVVVVLISGRPMIINNALDSADAFVAAWLPGTEGQGISDVLFGDYNFKGKLSHTWPKSMKQIPINFGDKDYDPLFPYGFGLNYK